MSYWRIGHRGACGHAPENTIASFRKAIEFGVHAFEFDIQMSKDGVPMVIHDDTLERTTNGTGFVSDYTVKELQELNAGDGEKIPTLENLLDFVDKRCRLFIELKAEHCTESVCAMLKHYVDKFGWSYEQFFAAAFDHLQLTQVKTINSDIRTVATMVGIPVSLAAIAQEAGAWALSTALEHTSKGLVEDAQRRGMRSLVWTVNKPAHIEKAKALKVDGIFSDFPDRLQP